jgi:hypothetical protein
VSRDSRPGARILAAWQSKMTDQFRTDARNAPVDPRRKQVVHSSFEGVSTARDEFYRFAPSHHLYY